MTPADRHLSGDRVEDELRFHIDARTADLVASGLSESQARAQALREFGDLDDARQYMTKLDDRVASRRGRSDYVSEVIQDVKYAIRRLRAAPGFALAAVLTLALGIGANTAIFSLVYGVLLRPLPFPDPDRLYAVYTANRTAGLMRAAVSPVDLDDWRAQRTSIEEIGGYFFSEGSSGVNLLGRGSPRRLSALFFSPGFFGALGIQPREGRLPREDEMVRGGPDKVVLLSYGFWQREFGGRPEAVGGAVSFDGMPYSIIGVLPIEMRFPASEIDVYIPYSTVPDTAIPRLRQVRVQTVVARAKPGVGQETVEAEMRAITGRLAAQYAENRAWDSATVIPLTEVIVGPVRHGLLVLFGAVGLVLLLACVNVASLQLARAIGRGREVAVRIALGARRGRLVRQLLTESLVLSILGGLAGLALAKGLLDGLLILSAGQLPRAAEISVDPLVIGFALVASILTGLLFGIIPALRSSAKDAQLAIRAGGRSIAGHSQHRVRASLVVAEVAIAMMLVVGAALMARSFFALLDEDIGFNPDRLLAVQFTIDVARHSPPDPGPPQPGAGSPYAFYYEQIIEKVRTLPGVRSVAAVKDPPLRGNGERNGFRLPGRPVPAGEDPPSATAIHVSYGYFETIGARVDGREFTPRDRGGAPFVVVVNEAFARQFFPGERAVGKRLLFGRSVPVEIIGVVNDIRQVAMAEPAQPTFYLHNLQNSRSKMTVVVRTEGEPLAMADAVRQAIWSIDPQQAITAAFTFDDSVSRAMSRPRLIAVLLGAFGLVGLALGTVGIYGVLAALVHERRREIGVRLALGARPAALMVLIVRRGLILTAVGMAIGVAGAIALGRYMATVLYGVTPVDPATFAAMSGLLLATAAIASWLPARRAARVDPVETLRE